MFKQLIATLVAICLCGTSQAAMIATPTDRSQLLGVLERVEVQNQLQVHGVSIEQARARIAALTDAEAAQLAAQIDGLPAGGDGGGGALISAVLIVFLVLLLTDILGFTKVFPFTKPIK